MDTIPEPIGYKFPICDRIPTVDDLESDRIQAYEDKVRIVKKHAHRQLNKENLTKRLRKEYNLYNVCFLSVCLSFILGLVIGILIVNTSRHLESFRGTNASRNIESNSTKTLNKIRKFNESVKVKDYHAVSFTNHKYSKEHNKNKEIVYPKGLTDDMKDMLKDQKEIRHDTNLNNTVSTNAKTVLFENIFWGPAVENLMPQGYGINSADIWEKYVNQNEIVKMEDGCGRMQNRLVTFQDGFQACVRYRQNTDQIQGEIFSFYVAGLLNLTNLAPAVIKIVDVKDKLWKNVANDIASAEWASNRAVVLTQYIPSLEPAKIPGIFKPSNRHLNKNDVYSIAVKENDTNILTNKLKHKKVKFEEDNQVADHIDMNLNKKTSDLFVELAQWSDLIIFDYLTANLDRIVNNLFNYQWNINIMDGPAHNLAKKMDSGLLVFLDNESGLLHGYRLLKKYNVYHSAMLNNLCVFRKRTIDALKRLYKSNVGSVISDIFHVKNNVVVRDILPPLPEKNAKILHERISHVLGQVEQCEHKYSNR